MMATQIQQPAPAATTQSQPPVMMTASAQAEADKQTQVAYTKIIRGLGVSGMWNTFVTNSSQNLIEECFLALLTL